MSRLSQIEADYYDPDRHLWTPYDDQETDPAAVDHPNLESQIDLSNDSEHHQQTQDSRIPGHFCILDPEALQLLQRGSSSLSFRPLGGNPGQAPQVLGVKRANFTLPVEHLAIIEQMALFLEQTYMASIRAAIL